MSFLQSLGKVFSTFIAIIILFFGGGMVFCGWAPIVTYIYGILSGELDIGYAIILLFALIPLGIGILIFRYEWKIFRNIWKSQNSKIDDLKEEKSTTFETKQLK